MLLTLVSRASPLRWSKTWCWTISWRLLPGFADARKYATSAGALATEFLLVAPTLFSICKEQDVAERVARWLRTKLRTKWRRIRPRLSRTTRFDRYRKWVMKLYNIKKTMSKSLLAKPFVKIWSRNRSIFPSELLSSMTSMHYLQRTLSS